MGCKLFIAIVLTLFVSTKAHLSLEQQDLRRPFDQELYENVLDPVACGNQVRNMSQQNPFLMLQFLDAGVRMPRAVLQQNMVDLGNYPQCLGIDEEMSENMRIQGKYCIIQVPTDQEISLPQFQAGWKDDKLFRMDTAMQRKIEQAQSGMYHLRAANHFDDTRTGAIGLPPLVFRLAVCIPKPCTTEDAVSSLIFNISAVGFRFEEEFCRLPDDKQWVAADTVAVVVFSLIGFLTLLSTCYELWQLLVLKKDPRTVNTICTSFSIYTNTHRLLTFKSGKDTLECLDGIRVLSMMWVIVGHTFMMYPFTYNIVDIFSWFTSVDALWITTAPIAVDTFFMIAGVLLVYTSMGKMNGRQLLRKLHLFYLNRLLRMFPALAAIVLLEASVFHRITDGPVWSAVARNAQRCRSFWWVTLLHVQNYVTPTDMCIPHSWYIAIDIQLYIVSPLVLYWVLSGNKTSAWVALVVALLAILTGSTIFNFIMELPGSTVAINRWMELQDFMIYYYYNTLTRGAPFFIGMVIGYILHLCRGTKIKMNLVLVCLLWLVALGLFATPFYTTYLVKQFDWDNQTVDSLINSFQRSIWACALGWLIFACVHGYGGPVNWILSLPIWKLPSRLSYAMYLYHFQIMFVFADTKLAPVFFSVPSLMYDFIGQFSVTLIVALIVAVVIEAPFSTLVKLMLEKGATKRKTAIEEDAAKNERS